MMMSSMDLFTHGKSDEKPSIGKLHRLKGVSKGVKAEKPRTWRMLIEEESGTN